MRHEPDLICLSHLRWGFVFQRPNHLMRACSRERRVFFVEEPMFAEGPAHLTLREPLPHLYVVTPWLEQGSDEATCLRGLKHALDELVASEDIRDPITWYYTPMALDFARELRTSLVVYDVMDELSNFRFAPPRLRELERELFAKANLVFTGGQSLFEAKRDWHANIHLFPSCVDLEHYRTARDGGLDPADQRGLPHPRLGYFGVIDERIDLELLDRLARERPDWQIMMVGPVVKIEPHSLPRHPNLHYLGQKTYEELPHYLAGWDAAIMPFALNDATRFISPTKTLEYLAGGKPVVSTAVRDVVTPYGERGLVRIADHDGFVQACADAVAEGLAPKLAEVDAFISERTWDRTWTRMSGLMRRTLAATSRRSAAQGAVIIDYRAEREKAERQARVRTGS